MKQLGRERDERSYEYWREFEVVYMLASFPKYKNTPIAKRDDSLFPSWAKPDPFSHSAELSYPDFEEMQNKQAYRFFINISKKVGFPWWEIDQRWFLHPTAGDPQ